MDMVQTFANEQVVSMLREQFEPMVDPEFEADLEAVSPGNALLKSGRGVDAFIDTWREWLSAWETWWVYPIEFIDAGDDRVLVLMDVRARSKTDGVEMRMEGANLLTLKAGKLTRLKLYMDRNEAKRAAGLGPT
jgi:hypothetical protein